MSDSEAIERRLSAVERAVADGDGDVQALADGSNRERRLHDVEDRLETVEETITDLEAATQALRGYVGNVRSVNTDVEQRADAALAAVERLESRFDGDDTSAQANRVRAPERQDSNPADTGRLPVSDSNSGRGEGHSPNGGTRPTLDGLDAGREMPVPGARDGTRSAGPDDRQDDGEGVLERVRDAL